MSVAAQDAHAHGVEGGDPHPLGGGPNEVGDALAHLRRSLIGEGDREDLPGRNTGGQKPGDAAGQHAGLTGSCARDDEQRAAGVLHGFLLLRVEPSKQLLAVIRGVAPVEGARRRYFRTSVPSACGSQEVVDVPGVLCLRKFCLPRLWLVRRLLARRLRGDMFALRTRLGRGLVHERDQLFVARGRGVLRGWGRIKPRVELRVELRLRQRQFLCLFCLRSARTGGWLLAGVAGRLARRTCGTRGHGKEAVLLIRSVHRLPG